MLPTGWAEPRFAEIARQKSGNGKLIKGKLQSEPLPGSFPAFSASGQDVWREDYEYEGDAIIVSAVGARCGKAFRASGRWSAIANTHVVVPEHDAVDTDFLFRMLNDEDFWVKGGTAQPFVKVGATFEKSVPLPPLAEQRRIVAKLDALTARIARARADLERVPVLTDRMRTKVLNLVFAGGSGGIPLRQLSEFVTSGSRGWAKYYSDDGPIFVRVGDVRRRDIELDLKDVQRVSPPPGAEGARTALLPGDIVVTITADLGRVGVVPDTMGAGFVNQHVALVRPNSTDQSDWIAWYLSSDTGQQQMLAKDRGVTKAGLGLDDIRDVIVPTPPEHVRTSGLKQIRSAFARATRLEAEAARARALLDRLESAILAKAFRGELVPQDPNDEPAQTLLDRICAHRAAAPKVKRGRKTKLADMGV